MSHNEIIMSHITNVERKQEGLERQSGKLVGSLWYRGGDREA